MPLADGGLNTWVFRRQHHRTDEQDDCQNSPEDKNT